MYNDDVFATTCAQTGEPLPDKGLYAITYSDTHEVVIVTSSAALRIPLEERIKDQSGTAEIGMLEFRVGIKIDGSDRVQVDDLRFAASHDAVIEYLPNAARQFGLVAETAAAN